MNSSPSNIKHRIFLVRLLVIVFISIGFTVSAATKDFEDSTHVEYPDWFVESPFLDLAELNDEASTKGKKGLMLLFTTKGCSYCEQFIHRSLSDPKIAKLVQEKFDSIGMEIFDDAEMVGPAGETLAVKHFAKKEGVGFAPTLLFYDKNGKRVLRQIGYQTPQRFLHLMDYVTDDHYQSLSLRDFLATKIPKQSAKDSYTRLKDDALFDEPPYILDRSHFAASEPLLVIFEKPGCTECEGFHNEVMTLEDIRGTMKQFQVVRLNAMDNKTPVLAPDGKRITPSQWYEQAEFTQLPALLFFNEAGKQVLKTDSFVRHQRVLNTLNYVLEKAYKKNWTYQQFARSKGIERNLQQAK